MIRTIRIASLINVALLVFAPAGVAAAESPALDNETARTSYSLGYQIGGDFKRQGVEMDKEAVVKGIEDALSGIDPQIPSAEMNAILTQLKQKVVAKQRSNRREQELEYLAEGEKFLKENAGKTGVKTSESGLQYKIIKGGEGKTPNPTDEVTVNYRGTLVNGNEFDSSYKRGEPATFRLNGVIKGWTEGLQLIREGGKIQLFIPPKLAYAGRGPLAHRTLIFDVELIAIGKDKQAGSAAPAPAKQ